MGTKVEDLMQQKMALRDKKPTDAYIEDKKIERANKEHAIDEIYSKLTAMEKRVQTLSMDNEALREEAKQLRLKNKEMRLQKEAEETAKDENKEIHKQKKM